MIKECKVLKWNELVMVIDFDGVNVQMPSYENNVPFVYIKLEKERYSLSSKAEYELSLVNKTSKHVKAKIINEKIDE
ncbi:MAG: hypothetical protein LBE23_05905 [Vagococcus sp.]|jgi:hypothetical protein|nr:hypothetical protein [Vagococcus sp.]